MKRTFILAGIVFLVFITGYLPSQSDISEGDGRELKDLGKESRLIPPVGLEEWLRWGIVAHVDKPFYRVGETVWVEFILWNNWAGDAYGIAGLTGDEGCTYFFTIQDASGMTLRQTYTDCLLCPTQINLPSGSFLSHRGHLPLAYLNSETGDPDGEFLPPGAYRVAVRQDFNGPRREPFDGFWGTDQMALIPIRIE